MSTYSTNLTVCKSSNDSYFIWRSCKWMLSDSLQPMFICIYEMFMLARTARSFMLHVSNISDL